MTPSCLLALSLVLAADGPAEWSELYDARLLEVADGRSRAVTENLSSLLSRVDEGDPLRGEVAYWLAHARLALGEIAGAREALAVAMTYERTRSQAAAFSSQIDAIERQVDELPLAETFDEGEGPLVHSWQHFEWGRIERAFPPFLGDGDNAGLRWSTQVRDYRDDMVFLSFAESAPPVGIIRFRARAEAFPAYLRVVPVDRNGREYPSGTFLVSQDGWTQVELPMKDLLESPEGAATGGERLQLQAIHIQDASAQMSGDRGNNAIWFDDLIVE